MAQKRIRRQTIPDFAVERRLGLQGYETIAGVDEVGRGPLAGPVTVAAVILDPTAIPPGIADSKSLSERRREHLFDLICESSCVAVSSVPAPAIDELNIRQATLLAMVRAVHGLAVSADFVLVDGRDIPDTLGKPAEAIIGGDGTCLSIAAASIVAKTVRDRLMARCHSLHPHFQFKENKGYPTAHHRQSLIKHGPTELHRRSFGPVAAAYVEHFSTEGSHSDEDTL